VDIGSVANGNQMDNAALLSLAEIPSLQLVKFKAETPLMTPEGISAFQKRRPDVKIEGR